VTDAEIDTTWVRNLEKLVEAVRLAPLRIYRPEEESEGTAALNLTPQPKVSTEDGYGSEYDEDGSTLPDSV
jgi:hypothetical protein